MTNELMELPYLQSHNRYIQQQAAQVAISLRQLGQLSTTPSTRAINRALSVVESRQGYRPELKPELRHSLLIRCGQMAAQDLLSKPIPSFTHKNSNSAAAIVRRVA